MTSRECMARQIGLIRATPDEYDALVGSMSIDPYFADFAQVCEGHGIAMTIVSDGPDRGASRSCSARPASTCPISPTS